MQAQNTPKSKITALFALMMAFLILFVFYFFSVDILKINDDFYQSLTLSITIFFSICFLKIDDLNFTFYYFYRYVFLFIFIGSTKPFSFAQICRSKDQMFEQSIMG
jgi:hypothetical protein